MTNTISRCANGPWKRSQRSWEHLKALDDTQVWEYYKDEKIG